MKTTKIALHSLFLLAPVLIGGAETNLATFAPRAALAQAPDVTPASTSTLASIALPKGALRMNNSRVPKEVSDALAEMMKAAGPKVKRGASEFIAWSGNGYSLKNAPKLKSAVAAAFKNDGWTYEEQPGDDGLIMVSALKEGAGKGLIGFWASDKNMLLLAWTEMLPANAVPAEAPAEEQQEQPEAPDAEPVAAPAPAPVRPAAAGGAGASSLTGIKMPRGGTRFDQVNANFSGVLGALAKEEVVKQAPAGEAEVFAWRGESYKPTRSDFTKTAVSAALTQAGYAVKEITTHELRNVNVFEHFNSEDKSLPFRPTTLRRPSYFQATNEAKGSAVLGAWIEDDDALALGLLPLKFKAKPKAKRYPPSRRQCGSGQDFKDTPRSASAQNARFSEDDSQTWHGARHGQRRRGQTTCGRGSRGALQRGRWLSHHPQSPHQCSGHLQVLLPAGIAEVVEAKANITFDGRSYEMYLAPVSGDFKQFEV
jgi:hypothetical protein